MTKRGSTRLWRGGGLLAGGVSRSRSRFCRWSTPADSPAFTLARTLLRRGVRRTQKLFASLRYSTAGKGEGHPQRGTEPRRGGGFKGGIPRRGVAREPVGMTTPTDLVATPTGRGDGRALCVRPRVLRGADTGEACGYSRDA
jgi:hypothetical protein